MMYFNKKAALYLALIALFGLGISNAALSQAMINIDPELTAHSVPLSVGAKGGFMPGPVTKYKFGRYQIIQSKNKWTEEANGSQLFGGAMNTGNWRAQSFVFQQDKKKNVIVNRASFDSLLFKEWVATPYFELILGDGVTIGAGALFHNVKEYKVTQVSSFTTDPDSAEWILVTSFVAIDEGITPNSNNAAGEVTISLRGGMKSVMKEAAERLYELDGQIAGRLTNGHKEIIIKNRTTLLTDSRGKPQFFSGMFIGYEFFLEDKSIAAVQVYPINLKKKFVRIHDGVDADTELALATAIASFLADEF